MRNLKWTDMALGLVVTASVLLGPALQPAYATTGVPAKPHSVAAAPEGSSTMAAATRPAPKNIRIRWAKKSALLSWSRVAGAKYYDVEVSKQGYYGPWIVWSPKTTRLNLAYTKFPYRDRSGKPYVFRISANGGTWTTVTAKPSFDKRQLKVKTGVKVTKAPGWKKKAVALTKKCVNEGAAMVVGGLVAGGVVLVAATWIPAIGPVTGAVVVTGAVAAGVGQVVYCVLMS
jgi:hypothetical protein